MKKTAAILFVCSALAAAAPPAAPRPVKFTSEGGYFKCLLPAGWGKADLPGQPAAGKKVYGIDLLGPAKTEGVAPSISVKYYAKGNSLFRSAAEFLRIHSRPIPGLAIPGEEYGAVTDYRLAKRPAKRFDRKKRVFTGPKKLDSEPVTVFERYIVLPAAEGFFALHYFSAHSSAKANLPAFETVLASFEPQ